MKILMPILDTHLDIDLSNFEHFMSNYTIYPVKTILTQVNTIQITQICTKSGGGNKRIRHTYSVM